MKDITEIKRDKNKNKKIMQKASKHKHGTWMGFEVWTWRWTAVAMLSKINLWKCLLTCLHDDRHGGLLDDGSYSWKSGEAAVIPPAVFVHGVGEVKVPVQAHGHPLVLLDVLEI